MPRTAARLLGGKIDLIYERYSLFLFAKVLLAKVTGKPIVIEVNDSCLVPRLRSLRLRGTAKFIESLVFRHATVLAITSKNFLNIAKAAYPSLTAAIVTPNGIDERIFDPNKHHGNGAERPPDMVPGQIVCGFFGAFAPWHGVASFVKLAARKIQATQDQLHPRFLLVGDGTDYQPLILWVRQQNLQSHFVFPGRVAHAEIPRYLSAMDLTVLPASNEYGSPMVGGAVGYPGLIVEISGTVRSHSGVGQSPKTKWKVYPLRNG